MKKLFFLVLIILQSNTFLFAQTSEADALYESALRKTDQQQFKEANTDFEKAAKLYAAQNAWQKYVSCQNGRGWNFVELGQTEEGIKVFDEAIKTGTAKLGQANTSVGMAYNNRAQAAMHLLHYDQAIADYKQTIAIWTPLLDKTNASLLYTRGNLAMAYDRKGEFELAIGIYQELVADFRQILGEQHPETANLYNAIGVAYAQQGKLAQALEQQEKALKIRQKVYGDNSNDVAKTYRNMGYACLEGSKTDKAIEYFDKALKIHQAVFGDNHRETAASYAGLASAYAEKPDYKQAENLMLKAVQIQMQTEGQSVPLAANMSKLGIIYAEQGDFQSGVLCLEKALQIDEAVIGTRNHPEIATDFLNIGVLHLRQDNHIRAAEYFAEAIKIQGFTLKADDVRLVNSYNLLGLVLLAETKYKEALELFEQSLVIVKKSYGENNLQTATCYHHIGGAYYGLKDYAKAQQYFEKSVQIKKGILGAKHLQLQNSYVNLGKSYIYNKQYSKALVSLEAAQACVRPVFGEKSERLASVYHEIAVVHLMQGKTAQALTQLQNGLRSSSETFNNPDIYTNPKAEQLAPTLDVLLLLSDKGQALETQYAATHKQQDLLAAFETYETAIALLSIMRNNYDTEYMRLYIGNAGSGLYEKALRTARGLQRITQNDDFLYRGMAVAEKSKAGTLLNAIQDANAVRFSGLPDSVQAQENRLKNAADYLQRQLSEHAADKEALDSVKLMRYGVALAEIRREYNYFLKNLEKNYPKYYALRYSNKTIDLKAIKHNLLKENEALIEYYVGKDSIYAFAATRTQIQSFVLPQENILAYDVGLLRKQIASEKALRLYPTFRYFTQTAHELYKTLLAPVEGLIAGKDLIIVADRELNQLPFEVLLTKEYTSNEQDYSRLDYLLKSHTVRYASSAAVLAELTARNERNAPNDYLAFAPVFAEGSGVGKVKEQTGIFRPLKTNENGVRGYLRNETIAPIPETATEVAAVEKIFTQQQGKTKVYTFGEAHETQLKGMDLDSYKYVHFATHGFCTDHNATDAAGIILSQEGNKYDDGVLYSGEVYGLRLNAKLVVLSACETGLGKEVNGEGLTGLATGFFHAGANGVVVSLWQVADQSTSELMISMFRKLSQQPNNAEALRAAKLKLIGQPQTASPFFWAAFILQGR
ncbi:CHAT domain-containing protein [Flexibacter flexilis DSM 6793]|uniref:CHAT domain-containing protein n=1 Tax=Flexibacter flexilis DSM 6793 TaxID=927664 RepID=A0A1I1LHI5_9BACT|nr:CHAT domain-containing protein [Flexibacter flexilis]SFC70448.1 CHAT domain-containing protein [Flexibacter flexilis DSM 6793]